MRKFSRVLIPAAVVSVVMALTPMASADMASPLDAGDGCGAEIHHVQVGGQPFVSFSGDVQIHGCIGPIQTTK